MKLNRIELPIDNDVVVVVYIQSDSYYHDYDWRPNIFVPVIYPFHLVLSMDHVFKFFFSISLSPFSWSLIFFSTKIMNVQQEKENKKHHKDYIEQEREKKKWSSDSSNIKKKNTNTVCYPKLAMTAFFRVKSRKEKKISFHFQHDKYTTHIAKYEEKKEKSISINNNNNNK